MEQPHKDSRPQLLAKIAKVKAGMGKVIKGSKNPFFKSNYADLNAHLDLVEPLLAKEGLVLTQPVVAAPQGNVVLSKVFDVETGEFLDASMALPIFDDMQKLGGAITYARRYTLGSLFSMGAEDDDGNMASSKPAKKASKKASPVSGSDF